MPLCKCAPPKPDHLFLAAALFLLAAISIPALCICAHSSCRSDGAALLKATEPVVPPGSMAEFLRYNMPASSFWRAALPIRGVVDKSCEVAA